MLVAIALWAADAGAQPASPPTPTSPTISAAYETHRDRLRYEFENPSNITTSFLVPHTFAQTYVADNQWLVMAARYRLWGDLMQTEFGITPSRSTHASDFDTFFNPDNDVVVSGTDGPVSTHALRIAHWTEERVRNLVVRLGYAYRRDMTDFGPADRVVTHSNPPSLSRTPITTHENTVSQTHEVSLGLSKHAALSPAWRLSGGADVSPIMLARLTTILPEKYPGQDIVFQATVGAANARIELARQKGRWPLLVTAGYGRSWSYQSANQFSRNTLQVGVRLGIQP
jgi:hypothetical protein